MISNPRIKNFIALFSGTIAAQAINFIFYIFLARFYSQTEFGVFSLFSSYLILTSILTNPQIPLLSLTSKTDEDVDKIETLSENVLLYSLIPISIFSIGSLISGKSALGIYFLFLPLAIFLYTLTENRKVFSNQREQFKRSNLLTIVPRTSGNLFKILLSKLSLMNGLILGDIIGNLYTLVEKIPKRTSGLRETLKQLKVHKRFLLFNTPSTIATVAVTELLPFFVISLYGLKTAGAYFLFEKFLLQPFTLIGSALGSSQAKYISSLNQQSKQTFFFKLLLVCSLIFVPMIILLSIYGSEILFLITKKELFGEAVITVLALFIPLRVIRGIIHVFHHSSSNWNWGVLGRGIQISGLLLITFICKYFNYSEYSFFLLLLVPEYLGELVLIQRALYNKKEI